ncbi:MAG TPA: UPF0149 family protein [Opitutaceae bacterium]|nr:UPF0149 family protein [Opitutaceae bacterium]
MSRHSDSYKPLTEQELYELAHFLESPLVPPTTMRISAVNGLLTSIIIGPRPIPPNVWMNYIWGQGQPRWQSQQQAEAVASLLVRHLNTVALLLASTPPKYAPLTYTRQSEGKSTEIVTDWCFGFCCGVKLDTDAWRPVVGSTADPFLAIIRAMLEPEVEIHAQILAKLSAENGTPAQILATCVIELHRFWLARQPKKPAAPAGSAMPLPLKLGRNDPCPCGSGRKYKNCCGSSLPHEPTPPAAPQAPKA